MKKVYLAGQPDQYDNWRNNFENIQGFDFYNPDTNSDQSSSDTFFPQDLKAVSESNFLIANPGLATSEGTWIEIGYFLALNTKTPGEQCKNMIIIWNKERVDWSVEFVKKAGFVVNTPEEAVRKLQQIGTRK